MALDKTLTVKQRRIDVYLPTMETKKKWNEEAARRGQSISQFVFETMELALHGPHEDGARKVALAEENTRLLRENDTLLKRQSELEILLERAEVDLREYRALEFLGGDPIKRLDPRLIKHLSEAKNHDGNFRVVADIELKRVLKIQKGAERELKSLAKQLELLELHQVVKKTTKGWAWVGQRED